MRGEQGASAGWTSVDHRDSDGSRRFDIDLIGLVAEKSRERGVGYLESRFEHVFRRRKAPGVGNRTRHHRGVEVVEGRGYQLRRYRAQSRRTRREVAHPSTLEPRPLVG